MTVLIKDRGLADEWKARRRASDSGRFDEVWDGLYVVSPVANYEHQWLAAEILVALHTVLPLVGGGKVMNGINVSDREEGWPQDYRVPDLAVILNGNPGQARGAHFQGGPDLVIEILSPDDSAREKRAFYARLGVREFMVLDRDPWSIELYELQNDALVLTGVSRPDQPEPLRSKVLPLTWRLVPGESQPRVVIDRNDGTQQWRI